MLPVVPKLRLGVGLKRERCQSKIVPWITQILTYRIMNDIFHKSESPNREWLGVMNVFSSSFRSHPRFCDYAGMGDPTKSRVFAVQLQLISTVSYLSDVTISNVDGSASQCVIFRYAYISFSSVSEARTHIIVRLLQQHPPLPTSPTKSKLSLISSVLRVKLIMSSGSHVVPPMWTLLVCRGSVLVKLIATAPFTHRIKILCDSELPFAISI